MRETFIKVILALSLLLLTKGAALAFPTWIGTTGNYKKHDDRSNPGQFSILMNDDYYGLQAAVGIQVNNGPWVEYSMNYTGNVSGNSYWTYTPASPFPGGSTVKYYFHGYDNSGNNIYDNRNGFNYEFVIAPDPEPYVQQLADGLWVMDEYGTTVTSFMEYGAWVDFKIRNIGSPMAIGILWTWNNWEDYRYADASFEEDLGGDSERWGVDLLPAGLAYSHRSLGFTRWYPEDSSEFVEVQNEEVELQYAIYYRVGGTWFWDNNQGQNYSIVIGNSVDPNDTDGDGLQDDWELSYFGDLSQSATDNPDGDGVLGIPMDNIIEQVTLNNPNIPNDPTGVRLLWSSSYPTRGETITLSYFVRNQGNPLFGKPVYAHVGHNGWADAYDTSQLQWNGATARYETTIVVPADATELNIAFTDLNGNWDNNNGADWNIPVRPPGDSDGDDLLDPWEFAYFGDLSQSATDNPDGDGVQGIPMTNVIEHFTFNDPNLGNDPTGVRLLWSSSYPTKGETITLSYYPGNEAAPLFNKPVYAHVGHNGWTNAYDTPQLQWNGATARYETSILVPADATELDVAFTDLNGTWDDNNGFDWHIPVQP